MRPFSIIVFLLIINSSFSLFCYEQITNGEEKIIPCDTLCYTVSPLLSRNDIIPFFLQNVRITESLTEIVRRGCSDRLPFNVRATIYMKYGIYVEKPLCTGVWYFEDSIDGITVYCRSGQSIFILGNWKLSNDFVVDRIIVMRCQN